jgi:hypothetical protein
VGFIEFICQKRNIFVSILTPVMYLLALLSVLFFSSMKINPNAVSLSRKSPLPGGRGQGRGETGLCSQSDFSPSLREGSLKETALKLTLQQHL